MTSFNDKAGEESSPFHGCVRARGSAPVRLGVNNSEMKLFVFRGRRQRRVRNIWEEITLKAVSSKLMGTDAEMSG